MDNLYLKVKDLLMPIVVSLIQKVDLEETKLFFRIKFDQIDTNNLDKRTKGKRVF
jgi:hypothetical protein